MGDSSDARLMARRKEPVGKQRGPAGPERTVGPGDRKEQLVGEMIARRGGRGMPWPEWGGEMKSDLVCLRFFGVLRGLVPGTSSEVLSE